MRSWRTQLPPLEAPDPAAPPAKLGDAQARRSLFDVSVNGRTRHAPGLLLQRQDRHDAGQFQDADGHLHVVLEPRSQHARAVFGAGVAGEGGGGGGATALRR